MSDERGKKEQKKEPSFGNDKLKAGLSKWKTDTKPVEPPKPRAVHLPPVPPKPATGKRLIEDEEAMFRAAVGEVELVKRTHRDSEPVHVARTPKEVDEDAEAFAQLIELVATGEGMDISDTDEYIEGLAVGADAGLLDRLRRGDFSFQGHVDLHGLVADAAKTELERFLTESRRRGDRCVLVVHGRGLHSKDQVPVLKSRIGSWLSRGRLARIVLAFATARPVDGGAGALYVLLRK